MDALTLQAQPHAPDCHTRRVGSTEWPWCDCGKRQAVEAAGFVGHRDGPSVRPNWRRGKR